MERLRNIDSKTVVKYGIPLAILVTLFLFVFVSIQFQWESQAARIAAPVAGGIYYGFGLVVGVLFFKDTRIKVCLGFPFLGPVVYGVLLFILSAYIGLFLLPIFLFYKLSNLNR